MVTEAEIKKYKRWKQEYKKRDLSADELEWYEKIEGEVEGNNGASVGVKKPEPTKTKPKKKEVKKKSDWKNQVRNIRNPFAGMGNTDPFGYGGGDGVKKPMEIDFNPDIFGIKKNKGGKKENGKNWNKKTIQGFQRKKV